MPYECKITKEEFPIPFTIGSHNLATWQIREIGQNDWQVFHEVNGMGTKDWQNSTPLGIDPRNRIGLFDENSMGYSLHNDNHRSIDLWTGSCEEAENKFQTIMGENGLADAIQAADIPYPPFGFIGEDTNSNAANTTVNLCVAGKDPEMPTWRWTPGEGISLLPNEQIEQICDIDLSQHTNSNNFFNDYLNQYAEDNGISHINTYNYHQFANDDNSYSDTSYLNNYDISFGSGYWNSTVQTVSAFELERLIDHSDWAEVDNILSELRHGTLRLDGSLSHSAEQKLIGNSDSVFADDFFFSRSAEFANPDDYYQSKYGGYNNNPYDLSWEMNAINNSIRQNYVMQEYLAQQEYWDSVINDIQSSTNNMTNTLSRSLNNNSDDIINANSTAIDNNIIAKVSDDPIMLIKDENGIDKAIKASEYAQYQNLLQNSNNAFDNAQQEISEELNYLQKELNQKIDDIGFDIGNLMALDEYNNQSSINNDQIEKMSNMSFDFDDDIAFNNENNVLAKVSDNPPRLFEDNNGNQKTMTFDEWLKENPSNFEDDPLFVNIEDDINDKYTERDDSDEQDWLF